MKRFWHAPFRRFLKKSLLVSYYFDIMKVLWPFHFLLALSLLSCHYDSFLVRGKWRILIKCGLNSIEGFLLMTWSTESFCLFLGQWCLRRGRVVANRDWGPGFDSRRRLKFIFNFSVFMQIFCLSFCDTHFGRHWLFHLSVFPVQLVKSTPIFLLSSSSVCKRYKCSFSIYPTLLEPRINA